MAQDFFYIDPQKIPPRRISGGSKKAKPRISEPADAIEDNLTDYFPQFNLENNHSDINTVLVSSEENIVDDFSKPWAEEEEEADPLTAAIFGGGPFELEPAGDFFINQPPAPRPNNRRILLAEKRDHLAKEHRAVLSELEDIENQDQELTKTLARINLTRRQDSSISTPKISSIDQEVGAGGLDFSVEIDQDRANDDWFGVGLAYTPTYRPGEKIKNKNSSGNKTWLVGLAALLIPLTFGWLLFSGNSNFVKNSVAAINSKLLSAASFTLINSEASGNFPFLAELKNKMAAAGAPADAVAFLDKFLDNNISFAWGDVFKKKAVWNENGLFNDLDSLFQVKTAMLASPASAGSGVFKKLAAELENNISLLSFWQELFRPDQSYLIVLGEAKLPRPIGGKPISYVLVKTTATGLEIINSGYINALDAATSLKVVPPTPLQVFSTAWLPGESGWFLDFNESAKTFLNFFSDTAKFRPNGIIFISQDGLNSLSLKEGLLFNAETPEWFLGLIQALARKPDSRIIKMANSINDLIQAHKIQFYFENDFLKKFVSNSGWSVQTASILKEKENVLGLAWVGDKEGLVTEMAEHKSEIYEDGSVKVKLNLSLRQAADNASVNYYKIYLPRGSQISKILGFSERKKIPKFDYASQGFSADTHIVGSRTSEVNKDNDVFEETGLTVLGGWLNFEPDERKTVSVEYVLPFNLAPTTRGKYSFKIWRPHQAGDMPFRLIVSPQQGVDILSLEPGGFVSGNSGEYQGNLSRDLQLGAVLRFD